MILRLVKRGYSMTEDKKAEKKSKKSTHDRAGQTLYTMWVPDGDLTRWRAVAQERGYRTLAKFIKELINGHVRDSQSSPSRQENTTLQKELGQLRVQQQETIHTIDTKLEELKGAVLHTSEGVKNNVLPEIKSRILGVMEVAEKPIAWKALLRAVGAPKKVVGDALEDLLKKGIVAMTKYGDWTLVAEEDSREE